MPDDVELTPVPQVWWVNQGSTFAQERRGEFIWAPLTTKQGHTRAHWEAMDRVRAGDTILHYSNGFLRAVSTAEGPAAREPNPLDTDAWNRDGRIVHTSYRDLADPVALSAIPQELRAGQGGPFTIAGSVQQGYLFPVSEKLAAGLAEHSPELRDALGGIGLQHADDAGPGLVEPGDITQQFADAVASSGLYFPAGSPLVPSFLASILAKPFAIMTGLSGSGKTQLAMRLGEWFGLDDHGRARHLVVPVRPDWTGPEALFGYEDALRSAESPHPVWHVPEPLEFMLRAAEEPTYPYLLVLDEMNLAHVERYFADFLSGVESRRPVFPQLTRDEATDRWTAAGGTAATVPVPRNLVVVGTVNVDETTYMFSPKVLDRASTFEFRVQAASLAADRPRPRSISSASDAPLRSLCVLAADDEWHVAHPHPAQDAIAGTLRELHAHLARADMEFGHRTFREALRFAAFYAASGDGDPDRALDLIAMQKLLPKVHGSRRRIEPLLTNLLTAAADRFPATAAKLGRMLEALRANQFVSFTE